ncbi:MAG: TerC family protein [Phycisphaerae bacterium]|nr:TerC family protein [Phycisphaerae bacterium]
MGHETLFGFAEYWWLYASFLALVLVLLGLDLGVFNRTPHDISIASATRWTIFWVSLAVVFNLLLWWWVHHELLKPERQEALLASGYGTPVEAARRLALEFLSGYIVEMSLSVDNLFVFIILFNYFAVPSKLRHRVLFYGILGALISRGIFIAVGSILFQFYWVVIVFGAFLALTGLKLLFTDTEGGTDPGRNPVIRLLNRYLPVTDGYRGNHFVVVEHGKRFVTPLFITLVAVEITDIVFAVDSIPAIYGITREPLIVFTSNVFAILGLRSMFFVLAGAMDRFYLLKYGLGIVLLFVGLKMTVLYHLFEDKHFPTTWSLAIIAGTIGTTLVLSLMYPKHVDPPTPDERPAD